MADVFISYAREDRKAIEQINALFEAEGVTCWFDIQLSAGERFAERTAKELAAAKAVVVVWSKQSLTSDWVADEAGEARDTGRLAPISLDGSVPPLGFRQFQCVDFSAWTGKRDHVFGELLGAIRKLTAVDGATASAAPPLKVREQKARAAKALLMGVALVLAVAITAYVVFAPKSADTSRIAVFSFVAPAREPALSELGAGIADDIAAQLTPSGVEVIARSYTSGAESPRAAASRLQADFAVEGSVERTGSAIEAKVTVVAPDTGAVLWSQSVSGTSSPDGIATLRLRAARSTADALFCALYATRFDGPPISRESIALLLRTCGAEQTPDSEIEVRDLMAQLVKREPQFAFGHAAFAVVSASASEAAPAAMRDQLRADSRAAADRAIRLDPAVGDAYVALYMLENRNNFSARERWLAEGIRHDEFNTTLFAHYGSFLTAVGRREEGLAYFRRSAALDPLSVDKQVSVAWAIYDTGETDEGLRLIEALVRAWPHDEGRAGRGAHAAGAREYARFVRARMALFASRPGEAPATFAAYDSDPRHLACWQDAAAALASADSRARLDGAARIRACFETGELPPMTSLMVLSALGDVDFAFTVARRHLTANRLGYEALFTTMTAAMRADARFMPLARDIGLLNYWRSSGHWPDFCTTAAYDCRKEAARLAVH